MIQKLLYAFAAQETLALLEKINAMDSTYDSSYQAADHLHKRGKFNFVERKLLAKALKKVARRETLVGAMNVVVYNNVEGEMLKEKYSITQSSIMPIGASQACIVPSAAQSAWERQRGQNAAQNSFAQHSLAQDSILAQQYNQMYGVLR